MNLAITLNDGTVIYPSFDPAHAEGLSAFYNEQVRMGGIKAWTVI